MDAFATHLPLLMRCVSQTKGPILELGAGNYSTPVLHEVSLATRRKLVTIDSDAEWLSRFNDLASDLHELICVGMTDEFRRSGQPTPEDHRVWSACRAIDDVPMWSVVLVDHRPGQRRADEIVRLANRTELIVVHDSQEPGYNYEPAFRTFKYRFDYKRETTWTTVVSNLRPV